MHCYLVVVSSCSATTFNIIFSNGFSRAFMKVDRTNYLGDAFSLPRFCCTPTDVPFKNNSTSSQLLNTRIFGFIVCINIVDSPVAYPCSAPAFAFFTHYIQHGLITPPSFAVLIIPYIFLCRRFIQ